MNEMKINATVDLENDPNIIQEEESFIKRNTLPFKGLLSNFRKNTYTGQLTTTGKTIKLNNITNNYANFNTGDSVKINAVVSDVLDITPPVSGEKQSEGIIVNSSKYHIVVYGSSQATLCVYNLNNNTWSTTTINGDFEQCDFFVCNTNNWFKSYRTNNTIYVVELNTGNTFTFDATNYPTLGPANNGRYFRNRFYFGRTEDDMSKCWSAINGGTIEPFQGCISIENDKLVVTGEPVYRRIISNSINQIYTTYGNVEFYNILFKTPNSDPSKAPIFGSDLLDYQIHSNGIISWYMGSARRTHLNERIYIFNNDLPEDLESWAAQTEQKQVGIFPSGEHIFSYVPHYISPGYTIDSNGNKEYIHDENILKIYSTYKDEVKSLLDYNSYKLYDYGQNVVFSNELDRDLGNPGWSELTIHDSREHPLTYDYPLLYMYSNIASNKGKTFIFGKGYANYVSSAYYLEPNDCIAKNITEETENVPTLIEVRNLLRKLNTKLNYWSKEEGIKPYDLDNTVVNQYSTKDWTYIALQSNNKWQLISNGFYNPNDKETLPWVSSGLQVLSKVNVEDRLSERIIWLTKDAKKNKKWPSCPPLIDISATDIPTRITKNNKISIDIYEGIPFALNYQNVLLFNSESDGIINYSYYSSGDYDYIVVNNKLAKLKIANFNASDIKISKIADYLFTSNIVASKSVWKEDTQGRLTLKEAFKPMVAYELSDNITSMGYLSPLTSTNDVWQEAGGFNANFNDKFVSSGYVLPPITIPFYIDSSNLDDFNKKIIEANKPLLTPVISSDTITSFDIYYTHTLLNPDITYKYSIDKNGSGSFDLLKQDNTWPSTSETIYFPIGKTTTLTGQNTRVPTAIVDSDYSAALVEHDNSIFLNFNNSQLIYSSNQIFTTYTSNYYFDGKAIYYIGGSSTTNTENTFACYALGMKFLGNSSTEAFFYSPFDNTIYKFSGSTSLDKWISIPRVINQFGEIIDTVFSSVDQTLYLLLEKALILIKPSAKDVCIIDITGKRLETINKGVVVYSNYNSTLYSPIEGNIIPLEIETSWIGSDTKLYKYNFIDLLFVDGIGKKIDIEVSTQTDKVSTQVLKDFVINKNRIRITPKVPIGNAIKLKLLSKDLVSIESILMDITQASDKQGVL